MKNKKWLWVILGIGAVIGFIRAVAETEFSTPGAVIGLVMALAYLVGIGFLIWYLVRTKDQRRAKREAHKAAAAVEKQKRRERQELVRRERARDQRPVWAKVVTSSANSVTKGNLVGTGARMLVGNALLGPGGVILGAATASKRTYTGDQSVTFAVKYASGRRGTETVKVNTPRFRELCAVLED